MMLAQSKLHSFCILYFFLCLLRIFDPHTDLNPMGKQTNNWKRMHLFSVLYLHVLFLRLEGILQVFTIPEPRHRRCEFMQAGLCARAADFQGSSTSIVVVVVVLVVLVVIVVVVVL